MDLFLVRHAIAGLRDPERWPDDRERPLTGRGEKRFRRVARRLARLEKPVERLWSSPLARAWQTAKILSDEAGWPAPEVLKELSPGLPPSAVVRFLRSQSSLSRAAMVGHEPHLHELASCLLAGSPAAVHLEMRKGGVAHLCLGEGLEPSQVMLKRLLPPGMILKMRR